MNASSPSSTHGPIMVTGASTGIGRAIVRLLTARGYQLHAIARSRDKLAALARETGCTFDSIDIRDTTRVRQMVEAVKPHVLVNNAGTSAAFKMIAATPEAIDETVDVNVTATLQLSRLALEHMLGSGHGQIVTIGSISGLHPTPSTVYAATKGAIHVMTMALRLELAGSGIRVTEICPGVVDTGLVPDELRKITSGVKMLTPDDVADAVRYAIEAPAHVNITTLELLPVEQAVGGVVFKPAGNNQFN